MIVVVGDFILDKFVYGHALRISPEAPNLVLDIEEIKKIRGGAYNVVEHLRNLGNDVRFISIVGRKNIDETIGRPIFHEFDNVIYDEDRLGTIKTRYVAKYRHTTLLRVDQEDRNDISSLQESEIVAKINELILSGECEGICIIDYCKGVVTNNLANKIIKIANENYVNTYVDTKSRNIEKFADAFMLKPNRKEFEIIKSTITSMHKSDEYFSKILFNKYRIKNILRTLGEDGAELYSDGVLKANVSGHKCDVKELSGAGDSLMAATVHLHKNGQSLIDAIKLANKLASIFISEGADYRITTADLLYENEI